MVLTYEKLLPLWLVAAPDDRAFTDDEIANTMKDAWKVNEARGYFYDEVKAGKKGLKDGVSNYTGNFGIQGLLRAGSDPVQQFIGSYRIDIDSSDGQNLIFTLTNKTSTKSVLYGIGPDWSRSTWAPGGNITQTYTWTEPINFKILP